MALRTEPIVLPDLIGLETGGPRLLPIDSIDEDPDQPRSEFDADALEELASTIRTRGVLQPVSVRTHPRLPGRWMLNFGSRRYRASKLAGRDVIPAFVDETCDSYAQAIENEQREALKPMELALFVRKRLALGEAQADIARSLGKSKAYISMAHALIDAPDWLMRLYRNGTCRGLSELYQLRRLHDQAAGPVETWCTGRSAIGRAEIQALGLEIGKPETAPRKRLPASASVPAARVIQRLDRTTQSPRLLAVCQGSTVELVTSEAPADPSTIFVVDVDTRGRRCVSAAAVTLVGFEGPSPT